MFRDEARALSCGIVIDGALYLEKLFVVLDWPPPPLLQAFPDELPLLGSARHWWRSAEVIADFLTCCGVFGGGCFLIGSLLIGPLLIRCQ